MATRGRGRACGSDIEPTRRLTDEVHLWSEVVDARDDLEVLTERLDVAEVARAERFRFERDRIRFIVRRAFLRQVLAGYLGVAPARVRYLISARGRPELESSGIAFSASHSDGLAVVAVARDRHVGVDLERVRPMPEALDLADSVCSPEEFGQLQIAAPADRGELFLRLWTRKEAYVKALGAGLSMALDEIDVGPYGDEPRRLPGADSPFVFADLGGIDGYVGSIAASGSHVRVRRITPTAAAA